MRNAELRTLPFETLVSTVAQGLREVYRSRLWEEISPRGEAVWSHYALTTGLRWSDVAERVRSSWSESAP